MHAGTVWGRVGKSTGKREEEFLRVTLEPTTSTDLLKNHHMVKMTLFYLTLTVDLFFSF